MQFTSIIASECSQQFSSTTAEVTKYVTFMCAINMYLATME